MKIGAAICAFFFSLSMLLLFGTFSSKDENLQKVEQGLMSKTTFKGHTYVIWSINSGGGIIHDPDCLCMKEQSTK